MRKQSVVVAGSDLHARDVVARDVTIQPTGVLGPMLGNDDPPSLRAIAAMLDGAAPVCPPFGTGYVDVLDVADLLRQLRPQLGEDLDASSAKAERLLGWRARPIADTIEDTAESILQRRAAASAS